jgi:Holliday junction resolvasome RuvABC endonuclease subunit
VRILALDISTKSTGWAIIDNEIPLASGAISGNMKLTTEHRMHQIAFELMSALDEVAEWVGGLKINYGVRELAYFAKNAKTHGILCTAQGILMGRLYPFCGVEFEGIEPSTWREAFYGYGSGTKAHTIAAVEMILPKGYHEIENDDEADAIGIGIGYYRIKEQELSMADEVVEKVPKLKKSRKKVA